MHHWCWHPVRFHRRLLARLTLAMSGMRNNDMAAAEIMSEAVSWVIAPASTAVVDTATRYYPLPSVLFKLPLITGLIVASSPNGLPAPAGNRRARPNALNAFMARPRFTALSSPSSADVHAPVGRPGGDCPKKAFRKRMRVILVYILSTRFYL